MGTLSPDAHLHAEAVQIRLLRQMPSWRKLYLVSQITRTCYALACSGLREHHRTATPDELGMRLAVLVLGVLRWLAHRCPLCYDASITIGR